MISGDFVDVDGVKQETPMQLINSLLKEFNEEEIANVANTLPVIVPISGLELTAIDDTILSKFISLVETKYRDDVLSLLVEKPKALCAYIINYGKGIADNFDAFFREGLSQECYANIIGNENIDDSIKERLIKADYNLIEIDGYEQIYSDYILNGHAVPEEVLWQFSNTDLDTDKKYAMLEICDYGGEIKDVSKMQQYLIFYDWKF